MSDTNGVKTLLAVLCNIIIVVFGAITLGLQQCSAITNASSSAQKVADKLETLGDNLLSISNEVQSINARMVAEETKSKLLQEEVETIINKENPKPQ